MPWRGFDPSDKGRCWSVPKKGSSAEYIKNNIIPDYPEAYETIHGRLDVLAEYDLIHWAKSGIPYFKFYLGSGKGIVATDMVTDIAFLSGNSKEKLGYPTQKPLALLERIIKASSNPGDLVLDPFCGCATACVAAENLDREWIGIDISEKAYQLIHHRLPDTKVTHRTDIPIRTGFDKLPSYKTHKHTLYGKQEGGCNGCKVHFPFRNMTIDHIIPQSKGGRDNIENLQLLCGACNSTKGNRSQEYLIARLKEMNV